MTVPFSSNPARSHASITGAYAAIVCFPGAARGGGAGGEAGPSASRYFLTVRQLSPVSRAISEMLTSACRSALNRRSSRHRSASSTNPQPPPREDQPIKATGSQLSRCVTSRRAARLCTFARTWLCTLARTPTSAVVMTSRVSFLEDSPQVRRLLDGTSLMSEKLAQQLHAQGVDPLRVPRFSVLRLRDDPAGGSLLAGQLRRQAESAQAAAAGGGAEEAEAARTGDLADLLWWHITRVIEPRLLPRSVGYFGLAFL